jgi:hypothetical protein
MQGDNMSQQPVVKVFTPAGKFVGQFVAPVVAMYPEHHYEISGQFVDEHGHVFEKLEFNPQVLPYTLDISTVKKCGHTTLQGGYIQRGRQPVKITASCTV